MLVLLWPWHCIDLIFSSIWLDHSSYLKVGAGESKQWKWEMFSYIVFIASFFTPSLCMSKFSMAPGQNSRSQHLSKQKPVYISRTDPIMWPQFRIASPFREALKHGLVLYMHLSLMGLQWELITCLKLSPCLSAFLNRGPCLHVSSRCLVLQYSCWPDSNFIMTMYRDGTWVSCCNLVDWILGIKRVFLASAKAPLSFGLLQLNKSYL